MAVWITIGVLVVLGLTNTVLLMRCGGRGGRFDHAADRETRTAILQSNAAIAKAALMEYRQNMRVESAVRELTDELALRRQLEQLRHAASAVNETDDDREKSA